MWLHSSKDVTRHARKFRSDLLAALERVTDFLSGSAVCTATLCYYLQGGCRVINVDTARAIGSSSDNNV